MMNQFDKGLMPTGTAIAEQREIPRMLDALMFQVSEIEERLEYLAGAISPILIPPVPADKDQKMVTPPLGSPLAMTLDQANVKLYQIHCAIRDIIFRVQL